ARRRYPTIDDVQLLVAGETRAGEPSITPDPHTGRSRSAAPERAFRADVCHFRPPLHRAGKAVARTVVANPVLGAERTDADGTVGLQSAVPVVRGNEHG